MEPGFTPIRRRSLADDVRQQLEAGLRAGAFAPGSQLPSEVALCRRFGVGRTSVREAIRELIVLGLVERRGARAHVVEQLPDVRFDELRHAERVREVFETRRLIEVQLTAFAAERAGQSERDRIASLSAAISRATSVEQLRPLDRAFHGAIAAAAGNSVLAELHIKVLEAVFTSEPFEALLHDAADDAETARVLSESASAHAAIAAAVVAGDVDDARLAALAHLDDVERRIAER